MKRLLRISFDLALLSFIPILSWFLLSIIIDKNLINIFTLTYPLQYIYYILKSIFSTGANISKEKDKNENAVMSGLLVGVIISIIIFSFILFNIDSYISFMNMDISIYRVFTIYSVLELFISLLFSMILNKLYYEEQNKIANKYSFIFNILNFILLIVMSLITKNQKIIVISTLIPLIIFTIYIYMKNINKFKFKLNILKCIKYDSNNLFSSIAFLLIYLFGISNVLNYGEEYAIALTFISLITDTQWDTTDAIVIAATIDISKNNFDYKEHIKNAYKLTGILLLTSLGMFLLLFNFYNLNLTIVLIYSGIEVISFIGYSSYVIKNCYLQLEYSALKTTSNMLVSDTIRTFMSFLKTPFCTGIGQTCSLVYLFISINLGFKKIYRIDVNGIITKKMK